MSAHRRRGAALPAVLGALVLVALLVAAVARDVVQAERTTRLVAASSDAPAVAESALLRAWAGWTSHRGWSLAAGATQSWVATERGAPVQLALTRLAASHFQLDAHASLPISADTAASGRAERGQSLLLTVTPARLRWHALVVTAGDLLGGALDVQPADTARAGESCAVDSLPPLAVVLTPTALLQTATTPPATAVLRDSAAGAAATYALAPPDSLAPAFMPSRELAAPLLSPTIGPQVDGAGQCVVDAAAAPLGWGDPAWPAPCAAHVPVVRVRGDLVRPVGRSQGLLLVDGDLVLGAGFEHWGVVIVQGRVHVEGSGDRLFGALLARGGVAAVTPGAVTVRRAPCAVRAALAAAGSVRPLGGWAWREWW